MLNHRGFYYASLRCQGITVDIYEYPNVSQTESCKNMESGSSLRVGL